MKNTIAATLGLLIGISAFGQSPPPAVIDQLGPDKSLKYVTKVSEIPKSVIEVMKTATRSNKLEMADKGGGWNPTDVIVNPELPRRRLIWAVETQKHFVVHYEQGGIGRSTLFLVVSPENDAGKRNLEWAVFSLREAKNLKEFLLMAKSGRLIPSDSLVN
jgi:hypothetical protein